MSSDNILVVEDEDQWHGLYQRAAKDYGLESTVRIAKDLATAERLIEALRFSVAFVDIGLDVKDDRNVDGLRVMEKIRATGDETSIVVVTGRSGQDAISIARDAMKKYAAFDLFGKSTVKPSDIRKLLEGGLEAYRKTATVERRAARDALLGAEGAMIVDDQILRATKFKGRASALYDFLAGLLDGYLPIVPVDGGGHAQLDPESGLVHGCFWSRAVASAIAVCFGSVASMDQVLDAALEDSRLLGKYEVGEADTERAEFGVKGAVFLLEGVGRGDFAAV
jgi:ActR/RegA family two-component response regulator